MREIKFRAWDTDTNKFLWTGFENFLSNTHEDKLQIIRQGRLDSSDCGKRITQTFKNAVVGFQQGNYYYYPKGNMMQAHQLLMYAYQPEIIGNIHQNPELLNQK